MRPIVLSLSGVAHSGKDTSADYFVKYYQNAGFRTIKIGLADRLKVICQRLIKLFYNIDIPIEDFSDFDKKEMIREDYPQFDGKPFKIRTILQQVGSECFRDCLWSSIWCDYVKRTFFESNQYDVIIISDCRFPNEIEYFEKMAESKDLVTCQTCRVTRPTRVELSNENKSHQSESHNSELKVMYEIDNSSSYEHLYKQLDAVIEVVNREIDKYI